MAQLTFDQPIAQDAYKPQFSPIPDGRYLMHLVQELQRPNRDESTGENFLLTFEILEGEHKGRLLMQQYNYYHIKPQTREIAQRQIEAFCSAAKVYEPKDTAELLRIPVIGVVVIRPEKDGFPAKNEIRGFEPYEGVTPKVSVPTSQSTSVTKTAHPWKK